MKPISQAMSLALPAFLAMGLAGCAAAPAKSEAHAHASPDTTDMQVQCEMHRKIMSGKPPAEQQAMMQEKMKSMTPEMRQRMQAMHGQCK
ncbi:hypothetical protein FN976_04065 [Caenimonas sedimenti]|uniref:DUF305 domain-containing protein n=1 Tax=Caenimonas sedimenti TaxID=2596921 RepID=A0A562ZW71_9BURK|nr:hypothetical protein [Caenimonas sedimenti]TWO72713.1 hypothetical protein FN976_04065 [Caenimonas sedimenti]